MEDSWSESRRKKVGNNVGGQTRIVLNSCRSWFGDPACDEQVGEKVIEVILDSLSNISTIIIPWACIID